MLETQFHSHAMRRHTRELLGERDTALVSIAVQQERVNEHAVVMHGVAQDAANGSDAGAAHQKAHAIRIGCKAQPPAGTRDVRPCARSQVRERFLVCRGAKPRGGLKVGIGRSRAVRERFGLATLISFDGKREPLARPEFIALGPREPQREDIVATGFGAEQADFVSNRHRVSSE